ncbi:MAG: fibronectin type III domain-containing protein [Treponema sp.]|jgi:hypothetical protein|nr:fibronectin type III domain-containing protein [Treponema sp.]
MFKKFKKSQNFSFAISSAKNSIFAACEPTVRLAKKCKSLGKTNRVFQEAQLSVLILTLAIFAGSCVKQVERGIQFAPETLGLTPATAQSDINLNWYADKGGGVSLARFIDESGKIIQAEGAVIPASGDKSAHKVTVKGLKPDTFYRYSVSNDGKNWSYEYNFSTPKTTVFRFASIGDPQLTRGGQDSTSNLFSADKTTASGWKNTMAKVAAANVNFIAGVGDQVDLTARGDEVEYGHFFAPPELRSIPWAPAVGNHDRHYLFNYHYNLPNEQKFSKLQGADYGNASNDEYADIEAAGNYWYRYNNALFVVLNTSSYPTSVASAAPIIKRFDDTLTAAKAAGSGYTWLFVQHHKSTASVADHLADMDIQYYVEAGFEELMTVHKVDFVLAGHDHVYARSFPLQGKKGGSPSVPDTAQGGAAINKPNGTIYVTITTGSGLKYYDLYNSSGNLYVKNNENYPYLLNNQKGSAAYAGDNIMNYNTTNNAPAGAITNSALWTKAIGILPLSNAVREQAKKPQYTVVEVEGNTVTFNTYSIDSDRSIDTFTVTK